MAATSLQPIAASLRRCGWLGLWIQLVVAILPVAMLMFVVFGRATGSQVSFRFTNYLAILGLLILAFTTCWFYRYTRLAKKMADPERQPPWNKVATRLWVGVWAGTIGITVSVMILFVEVVRLLIHFLNAPQAGVPVIRTEAESRADWVSALDVVSLLADLCTLIGELAVVGISLWLLFRITRSVEFFEPSRDS
jgi:Protein of unknown function (DUF3611)